MRAGDDLRVCVRQDGGRQVDGHGGAGRDVRVRRGDGVRPVKARVGGDKRDGGYQGRGGRADHSDGRRDGRRDGEGRKRGRSEERGSSYTTRNDAPEMTPVTKRSRWGDKAAPDGVASTAGTSMTLGSFSKPTASSTPLGMLSRTRLAASDIDQI